MEPVRDGTWGATANLSHVPGIDLSETARFAVEVALEASAIAMRMLPEPAAGKGVRYKSPTELVTRADHEVEEHIVGRIRGRFPHHAILGEEETALAMEPLQDPPDRQGDSRPPRWVIDPIDGTANFAHGIPWFAVSIALEEEGQVTCGVVTVPPTGECFVGERGRGAFLLHGSAEPARLAVSPTAGIGQALLATGLPREPDRPRLVRTIPAAMIRSLEVRVMGAAAVHLAYVAAGRLDAFWEAALSPWDVAAGILLVEEAGGMVTDLEGRPVCGLGGDILATNRALHEAMLEVIAG